jgi:hypothetical protein
MTVNIKTIYLDMDGVLCDFDAKWIEIFAETPAASRSNKTKSHQWDTFVQTSQFEALSPFPGWIDLLSAVKSYNVNLEILSSSGGQKYHTEVTAQKKKWLKDHGINIPVNIVPGRMLKSNYATANSLLIDDTPDVIMGFHEAGGYGILYDSAERAINMLKGFFTDEHLY